jgi:hypothetical protein
MAQVASGLPEIPAHIKVRPQDKPYLNAILSSRARDEWSDVDIAVANQLAWTQCEIAKEVLTIESEGTVVPNDRGTMVTNPRFRAINEHKQSQLALMKTLALHSMAKKDPREETNKRTALMKTKKVLNDMQDSLIAPP